MCPAATPIATQPPTRIKSVVIGMNIPGEGTQPCRHIERPRPCGPDAVARAVRASPEYGSPLHLCHFINHENVNFLIRFSVASSIRAPFGERGGSSSRGGN